MTSSCTSVTWIPVVVNSTWWNFHNFDTEHLSKFSSQWNRVTWTLWHIKSLQPNYLFNGTFRITTQIIKTPHFCTVVEKNPTVICGFRWQSASYAEIYSMPWCVPTVSGDHKNGYWCISTLHANDCMPKDLWNINFLSLRQNVPCHRDPLLTISRSCPCNTPLYNHQHVRAIAVNTGASLHIYLVLSLAGVLTIKDGQGCFTYITMTS